MTSHLSCLRKNFERRYVAAFLQLSVNEYISIIVVPKVILWNKVAVIVLTQPGRVTSVGISTGEDGCTASTLLIEPTTS